MAKPYQQLKTDAISALSNYLDSLDEKQASKLAYWIQDYTNFLKQETTFDPAKYIRYKRGAIVKAHLGYRIGREEGGLHYAIVLDANNALKNPLVTIIPLTSVKPKTDLAHLHTSKLHLGHEVYDVISEKSKREIEKAKAQLQNLNKLIADIKNTEAIVPPDLLEQIALLDQQVEYCDKILNEISKMKMGSIALVGQIVTISKQRIYDPKYKTDALSNIRVSDATLDRIDSNMQELFGHK